MKIKSFFAVALLSALLLVSTNAQQTMNDVKPPVVAKKQKKTENHGYKL